MKDSTILKKTFPSREDFIDFFGLRFLDSKAKHRFANNLEKSENETVLEDHIRYEIEYPSHNDTWVTGYLLLPTAAFIASGSKDGIKFPAAVVCHTHASNWEFGANEMVGLVGDKTEALALDLVRRGYIVLAPDMLGFSKRIVKSPQDPPEGGRGQVGFNTLVDGLNMNGDNYLRHVIQDTIRGIDVLENISVVDKTRIGAVGYSFGGHIVSKTAVFDTRIRATVAFGAIANMQTKLDSRVKIDKTESVHNILNFGDTDVMLRLIAPRALLISGSSNDWYAPKPREVYDFLKRFWDEKGAKDNLAIHDGYKENHSLSEQMKHDAYKWFDRMMQLK